MRLLLDTHTLLWLLNEDPALSSAALNAISDGRNEKLLSVGSAWEITIKVGLGKLSLKQSLREFLTRLEQIRSIRLLNILPAHLLQLAELPHHHRDPFDRLIVAQALSEGCSVISRDGRLEDYGVKLVW